MKKIITTLTVMTFALGLGVAVQAQTAKTPEVPEVKLPQTAPQEVVKPNAPTSKEMTKPGEKTKEAMKGEQEKATHKVKKQSRKATKKAVTEKGKVEKKLGIPMEEGTK
jgi:hypothetical protein